MASVSRACIALVLIGLVAAGVVAARRANVEGHNRSVQIAVEWNELRSLAYAESARSGRYSPAEVLRRLRRTYGVSGLSITEASLADLRDAGRVFLERDPSAAGPTSGARLVVPDPALAAQIVAHVNARRGPGRAILVAQAGGTPTVVLLRDAYELTRGTGVGFPPDALRAAREAGVEVIGRIGNYPGITTSAIEWMLAGLERQRIRNVIFVGVDVLGNKEMLPFVADAMQRHHLNFGFVEFGKQQGDAALARLMRGRVVRVHSITDAEMNQLTPPEAADRFVKAARERDVRLLYVRLFLKPAEDPVAANGKYLAAIGRGLRRVGLVIGRASPFDALYSGRVPLILAGIGVVAGAVLLLGLVLCLAPRTLVLLLVLGAAGSAALLAFDPTLNLARKLLALAAALVFPTLALVRWGDPLQRRGDAETRRRGDGETRRRGDTETGRHGDTETGRHGDTETRRHGDTETRRRGEGAGDRAGYEVAASPRPRVPVSVLAAFAAMSATTLAGALLVVGLLGDTRFLLKYDQFVGIKAAHMLPLLALAGGLAAGALTPAATWPDRWKRARASLRSLSAEPVLVWQIAAMALGMVAVLVLLMRTGNDPGVGVSPVELKMRAILDRVLVARPRTKEFLIGHPAMIVALWAGLSGRRVLWVPALLIGAIGQVSLLNTFCHIHTPLGVSALHAVNGLVLGALFGYAGVAVIRRVSPHPAADPRETEDSLKGETP